MHEKILKILLVTLILGVLLSGCDSFPGKFSIASVEGSKLKNQYSNNFLTTIEGVQIYIRSHNQRRRASQFGIVSLQKTFPIVFDIQIENGRGEVVEVNEKSFSLKLNKKEYYPQHMQDKSENFKQFFQWGEIHPGETREGIIVFKRVPIINYDKYSFTFEIFLEDLDGKEV